MLADLGDSSKEEQLGRLEPALFIEGPEVLTVRCLLHDAENAARQSL